MSITLAIIGVLSFIQVILARRVVLTIPTFGMFAILRPWLATLRRRGPRIVEFDEPRVNVGQRRFEIGHLRVEDPDGDLETVEISIEDERGNEVGRKTIDVRGTTVYEANPEIVPPRSRVYVREDGTYTVNVEVEDARQNSAGRSHSQVRPPVANPA